MTFRKRSIGISLVAALAVFLGFFLLSGSGKDQALSSASGAPSLTIDRSFGKMPLYFIGNEGQMDPSVGYYIQGKDKTVYFTSEGLTYVLNETIADPEKSLSSKPSASTSASGREMADPEGRTRWVVKMDFVGANPHVMPVGEEKTEATVSYFRGAQVDWKTALPTYSKVVYRDLWPGIDLVYSGSMDRMKYEFIVQPGADPSRIRLAYRGASAVDINDQGRLEVVTPAASFQDDVPVAWQEVGGQKVSVPVSYALERPSKAKDANGARATYGFRVGEYDRKSPLVLDPAVFVYCGYIGGVSGEEAGAIALDGTGNAYITGWTHSMEDTFPVAVGPDTSYNGGHDAFVVKVNAAGDALVYCGFIGGSDYDMGESIAIDSSGNAYITGWTYSTEATFPVTALGLDPTFNGGTYDAFVAKVNAAGDALVYCGYIGGDKIEEGRDIAVDSAGNAYITGFTESDQTTFPVAVGPDLTFNAGIADAFVAKVNVDGTALAYCTYLGGSDYERAQAIAVDASGNAYVTGWTTSDEISFPETVGPDTTYNGYWDAFVAKIDAAATQFVYCGYLGGSLDDQGWGIEVDASGNAYVTGWTSSTEVSFPETVGPDLTYNGGTSDAFVAKINAAGNGLVYCGFVGGAGYDKASGIALTAAGNVFITGDTDSPETSFPVAYGPDGVYNGGTSDAFVAKINAAGDALYFCGYIGGSGLDLSLGIAVDADENAYITGETNSTELDFPVTTGPSLSYNGGELDVFVAKIQMTAGPEVTSLSPASAMLGDPAFTLTVYGSSFDDGAVVVWDGTDKTTTFVSATELQASIAAEDLLVGKTVQVLVRNLDSSTSSTYGFTINNPVPVLSTLAPASTTAGSPAFTLTVTGTSFVEGAVVKWDGADRPTTFVSATELSASIAAEDITAPKTVQVTVANPGTAPSNALGFVINISVPTLTALVPSSAYVGDPAFTLTVTGTNFINGAVVVWDGADRTTTYVNSFEVEAAIPAADLLVAKTVQVTLRNPDGAVTTALEFTITSPIPTLSTLAPSTVRAGGPAFTLTVTGTDFQEGAVVKWDGADRTTTFVSSTQVTAAITADDVSTPKTVQVTAYNPGTTDSNALPFVVDLPLPVLTTLAPSSAYALDPAFTLTVNGTYFVDGAVVVWDGSDRTTTFVSATQVTAAIPASDLATAKTVQVTLRNPDSGVSNALEFTIDNPVPTVTSLDPLTARAGSDAFTLTVNGTKFVEGAVVKWDGADRTTTFVSNTQVTAAITAGDISIPKTVPVTVANPGTAESNAAQFLVDIPLPILTSLSPASAYALDPAMTLTVNGTHFVDGAVVVWDGSDRTTTFVSSTQVTAAISAEDLASAKTVQVTLRNPDSGNSNALEFVIDNPVPTLTTLAPSTLRAGGDAFTLTVTGTKFVEGAVVKWDGSDRPTTFVSNTEITAAITAADINAVKTVQVTAYNPGTADSNALPFVVDIPLPVLTSLAPSTAYVLDPAFTLTVNGTYFVDGAVVVWDGSDRTTTFVSSTQITAAISADDINTPKTVQVTVRNPDGGVSNALEFTVDNPVPTLTALNPTGVRAASEAFTLTVTGTKFVDGAVVKWDGTDRPTTFVSDTEVTAAITAADVSVAKTVQITVANPGTAVSNALSFLVDIPLPVLTSLAPSTAYALDPAFTLTVNGTYFVDGAVVVWDGSDRTTLYVSSTQVSAAIPADDLAAAKTVQVTVRNPDSGVSNALEFTIDNPVPTVTSLSPLSARSGSDAFTLTVTGTKFVDGAIVKWDGVDRATTFVSNTEITAAIPADDLSVPKTVQVTVYNPGTADSNAAEFLVDIPLPILSALSPSSAYALDPAFTLTVTGTHFVDGAVVVWDGSDRTTTFVSSTEVTAAISADDLAAAKTVQVTLRNPDGGNSNALEFTIDNPVPTVTALSPLSARAEGDAFSLTVTGTKFVDGAVVKWDGVDRPTTFVSNTEVTAAITADDLSVPKTVQITVYNPGTADSNGLEFLIDIPLPVLTSIAPTTAQALDPAFTLTVTGTNFVNGAVVLWDGADRPTTFVSTTEVTAEIGADDLLTAKTVQVTLRNPDNGNSNALEFVIDNPVPTISSFVPATVRAAGPAFSLTVIGTKFVDGAVVKWDGSDRPTTYVSSTGITAEITADDISVPKTVQITVANPGTADSNALDYLVDAPLPTLSNLIPSGATAGDPGFELTLLGTEFVDGAVVTWDGSDRPTTFVNSTALSATIADEDLATAKTVQVAVRNPDTGVSNALEFVVANPPPPAITSISPDHTTGGGSGFDLTVLGTEFVDGSIVRWNGADRTTTYVGPTELRAAIPATDLSTAGAFPVTVVNPIPAGSTSNAVSFTITGVTISSSPTAVTVTAGNTASYALQVSPQYGSFDAAVSFSCSGLPRYAAASISPATVTPGGSPAAAALTITTKANANESVGFAAGSSGFLPPAVGLMMLLGLAAVRRFRLPIPALSRVSYRWVTAAAVIFLVILVSSCSTSSPAPTENGTPRGTYTITVKGESGSLQTTTNITLVVR